MSAFFRILLISLIAGSQVLASTVDFEKNNVQNDSSKAEAAGVAVQQSSSSESHEKQEGNSYNLAAQSQEKSSNDSADLKFKQEENVAANVAADADGLKEETSSSSKLNLDTESLHIKKDESETDKTSLDTDGFSKEHAHDVEREFKDKENGISASEGEHEKLKIVNDENKFSAEGSHSHHKEVEHSAGSIKEQSQNSREISQDANSSSHKFSSSSSYEHHSKPTKSKLIGSSPRNQQLSGSSGLLGISGGFEHASQFRSSSNSRTSRISSQSEAYNSDSRYSVVGVSGQHVSGSGIHFGLQSTEPEFLIPDFSSFGSSQSTLTTIFSSLESNLKPNKKIEFHTLQPMFKKLEAELNPEDFLAAMLKMKKCIQVENKSKSVDIQAIFQLIKAEENKKISNQIQYILTQKLGGAFFIQDFELLVSIARNSHDGAKLDMSRILEPFISRFGLPVEVAISKITEIFKEILVQIGCQKGLNLIFTVVEAPQPEIKFIYAAKPKPVNPLLINLFDVSSIGTGFKEQVKQSVESNLVLIKQQPKPEAAKKVINLFDGLLGDSRKVIYLANQLQSELESNNQIDLSLILKKPDYVPVCQLLKLNSPASIQAATPQLILQQLGQAKKSVFSTAETYYQTIKQESVQFGSVTEKQLDSEFSNFSQTIQSALSTSSFSN